MHLEDAKPKDENSYAELYEDLASHYRQQLATLNHRAEKQTDNTVHEHYVELTLETLRVERGTAIRLRDEGRINDEILRRLERELDLNEVRLIASSQ